jgi:predicted O-linked N-acetylglucosamine transferase (SPINDLY family)
MRELEIDIAVDLSGYTDDSRPHILAHRPAAVQLSYLGFPGTTSAGWIDYLVTDAYVVPPDHGGYYDEALIRLPDSFFPSDTTVVVPAGPLSRASAELPEDALVFGCFTQFMRIGPELFGSWMRILQGVPGSVLWLRSAEHAAEENLRKEAAVRGVDPQRLLFAPIVSSRLEHLERHRLVDLFLDSFPYNTHSTARDALWAGVPVLTRSGESFASRVAGSLLSSLGVPGLITRSAEEYEACAIRLGQSPTGLRALRESIESRRPNAALFDMARLTRALEDAYEEVHSRWRRGENPSPLAVGRPG